MLNTEKIINVYMDDFHVISLTFNVFINIK